MDETERFPIRAAELVRAVQRRGRIRTDPRDERGREPIGSTACVEELARVDALDVLHRDEEISGDFSELVDMDDVRVRELRGELGFAEEHPHEILRIGEMWKDPFHRDAAIKSFQSALLREKHLGHATASDSSQQDERAELDASFGRHVSAPA